MGFVSTWCLVIIITLLSTNQTVKLVITEKFDTVEKCIFFLENDLRPKEDALREIFIIRYGFLGMVDIKYRCNQQKLKGEII